MKNCGALPKNAVQLPIIEQLCSTFYPVEELMTENQIAQIIVDAAFKIHKRLGPGLLESVFEEVLAYELVNRSLRIERQKPLPVIYKQVRLDIGFRIDLLGGSGDR